LNVIDGDANVVRAAALDTATLSDALDRLRIVGQCARIKPRDPKFRLAARAFTLQYGPAANAHRYGRAASPRDLQWAIREGHMSARFLVPSA
jgi:regulator of RNase E activity RraA